MSSLHVNQILDKLSELRAVFVLGQRAVPFLEETFTFLKEISPLLAEINTSIRDSTHKMPRAKSQLESVTQATELATTEILDRIDGMLAHVGAIKAHNDQNVSRLDELEALDAELVELLEDGLHDDATRARLDDLLARKRELRRAILTAHQTDAPRFEDLRQSANQIMMSLQVQDITAQQIAAANHLIESVRSRLTQLVQRLSEESMEDTGEALPFTVGTGPITFDANARYDHSPDRQGSADAVIAAFAGGQAPPAGPSSQSDIDALFGGGAPAPDGPASQSDIDDLFGGGAPAAPSEPTSQDDIDAFFGGGAPAPAAPAAAPAAGPASQSDIDDLFGGASDGGPASQGDIDDLFGGGASAGASDDGPASQSDIDDLFNR